MSLGLPFLLPYSLKRYHLATALLRRTSLHLVDDVCTGIESEPGTAVPQHAGQDFRVHTVGEGHGGEGVPQIVISSVNSSANVPLVIAFWRVGLTTKLMPAIFSSRASASCSILYSISL